MPILLGLFAIIVVVALVAARFSIMVVDENRRLAVSRLAQSARLAGPGLVVIVPILDRTIPVRVADCGTLLDDGTGNFSGLRIPIQATFSLSTGTRVQIERFEGSGSGLREVVRAVGE